MSRPQGGLFFLGVEEWFLFSIQLKFVAAYDSKIVEGVLYHQLKHFVIDGNKVILSFSSLDTKVDNAEFEGNEVYTIDIVTSIGDGKVIEDLSCWMKIRLPSIKSDVDKNYHLKMKASRFIFSDKSEISHHFIINPHLCLDHK
ncbi:hypothetical protein UlMin_034084 [Ulmus minor]